MELSSGLALKVLGGLAVASTIVTVGVVKKDSIASALGLNKEEDIKITKWDEYIKQAITKNTLSNFSLTGSNGSALSTFPTFTASSGQNSQQESSIIFKITASSQNIDDAGTTLKKKNEQAGSTEGKDWTWECTVKFIKKGSDVQSVNLSDTDKNLIYQHNTGGLLWKISQNNNVNEKQKVIDLCAKSRTLEINKKLQSLNSLSNLQSDISTLTNDTVKSEKVFSLIKKQNANELIFDSSDKSDEAFREWFSAS